MFRRRSVLRFLSLLALVVIVVGGATWWVFRGASRRQLSAVFPEAIGLYPGANVAVLGVPIGTVDAVHPSGTDVHVLMHIDPDVSIPAGAQAAIIEPSFVSGRYVQLTPAYTGGPKMADDATIPADRTAVPVEVDQLYNSLTKLSNALGPNGANKHGALSDLLNTGAKNLKGNGKAFGTMINKLGKATRTLSGSKSDMFGTIDNLSSFTKMLRTNDHDVRKAEKQLATVSGFLSADRHDLAKAVHNLGIALGKVQTFVHDNRKHIKSNVHKLASITHILVKERKSLAEALDVVPLALDNVLNTYDPSTGSLVGRGDLREIGLDGSDSGGGGGGSGGGGGTSPILPLNGASQTTTGQSGIGQT